MAAPAQQMADAPVRRDSATQPRPRSHNQTTPIKDTQPENLPLEYHGLTAHAQPRESTTAAAAAHAALVRDAPAADNDTTVILLGDGALAPVAPLLAGPSTPIRTSTPKQRVLSLCNAGDRIAHLAHRLQVDLYRALHAYTTAQRSRTLVILHIGACNLSRDSHPKTPLRRAAIAALRAVVAALAALPVHLCITALLPRAELPASMLDAANAQLRGVVGACTKASQNESGGAGVLFAHAPLALGAAHASCPEAGAAVWAARLRHVISALRAGDEVALRALAVERAFDAPSHSSLEDADSRKTCPHARMRPAQDVYARIAHDTESFAPEDVVIGYEDRHEGMMEIGFAEWRRESTDEEFVPMHRVRYFRRGDEMLWDRRSRVDAVFGSARTRG